jgi:hypothetical protein
MLTATSSDVNRGWHWAVFPCKPCCLIDALVQIEGKDPYWSESAQGLGQGAIMSEAILARRENRPPSLFNVRQLICEADEPNVK